MDGYPADTAREIARLKGRADSARELAGGDAWRAEHWQGVYEQLGVLRRHGQEGRQARERAEQFAARAEDQQQHAEQLETQAQALAGGPDGPRAWERAHPGVRERLYEAETGLAAAVDQRAHEPRAPGVGAGV